MRQFDVVANTSSQSRQHAPYFVVLQSHYLTPLESVVVAPLVRDASRNISIPDVPIDFEGERLLLTVGELFSIDRQLLKTVLSSVAEHKDAIRRALDRVFTGF